MLLLTYKHIMLDHYQKSFQKYNSKESACSGKISTVKIKPSKEDEELFLKIDLSKII